MVAAEGLRRIRKHKSLGHVVHASCLFAVAVVGCCVQPPPAELISQVLEERLGLPAGKMLVHVVASRKDDVFFESRILARWLGNKYRCEPVPSEFKLDDDVPAGNPACIWDGTQVMRFDGRKHSSVHISRDRRSSSPAFLFDPRFVGIEFDLHPTSDPLLLRYKQTGLLAADWTGGPGTPFEGKSFTGKIRTPAGLNIVYEFQLRRDGDPAIVVASRSSVAGVERVSGTYDRLGGTVFPLRWRIERGAIAHDFSLADIRLSPADLPESVLGLSGLNGPETATVIDMDSREVLGLLGQESVGRERGECDSADRVPGAGARHFSMFLLNGGMLLAVAVVCFWLSRGRKTRD